MEAAVVLRLEDALVLDFAFANQAPPTVQVLFQHWIKTTPDNPGAVTSTMNDLGHLMMRTVGSIFLEHFEIYRQRAWRAFGHVSNWPIAWAFSRVTRNAIGHGGAITIEDKSAPVTWNGLTYSKADNGRKIFERMDLMAGDLIMLMFEMGEELDAAGDTTVLV
jgi:hypothetical protein